MRTERTHRSFQRTSEEKARIRAVRARFANRPTLEELLASGDYTEPMPHGQFLEVRSSLTALKRERLRAGLSLADVSRRSGIDPAALSRLENGLHSNPTLDTLYRYAAAIGKRVVWSFRNSRLKGDAGHQKRAPVKRPA